MSSLLLLETRLSFLSQNTSRRKFVTVFLCVAEVRAVEPGVAGGAVDGREVPRDLGQPQTALLRLRRLCLLEIHPLTQCR